MPEPIEIDEERIREMHVRIQKSDVLVEDFDHAKIAMYKTFSSDCNMKMSSRVKVSRADSPSGGGWQPAGSWAQYATVPSPGSQTGTGAIVSMAQACWPSRSAARHRCACSCPHLSSDPSNFHTPPLPAQAGAAITGKGRYHVCSIVGADSALPVSSLSPKVAI